MTVRSKKKHQIAIVSGVCGLSIYLNGYRIAGDKPWGGGTTVKHWDVIDDEDIRAALKQHATYTEARKGVRKSS